MAVPAHVRLTLSGVFGATTTPIEQWSNHLAVNADAALSTPTQLVAAAETVKTAWGTHLRPLFSSRIALTGVRAASVGTNGRVNQAGNGSYLQGDTITAALVGSAAQSAQPALQTALVASLVTARPGPAGKGRIFLPWPDKYIIATDFRITAVEAQAVADAVKAFLNAVNTGLGNNVVVIGATSEKTGKPATVSAVTGVKVGRVPDTMRSRRGSGIEGYAVATL